jgi:hypothetical protein
VGVLSRTRLAEDLVRRPVIADKTVEAILPVLQENRLVRANFVPSVAARPIVSSVGPRVFELEGVTEPWVQEHIDYLREDR